MRDVDNFFERWPARPLWHYTGIGALLGIVENKRVFATHAYYLNDSRELLWGCDMLERITKEYLRDAERKGDGDDEFLEQLVKWLNSFRTDNYQIFLFSLSEESNSLSQWRSYTKHGKGVNIGFSPSRIRAMIGMADLRVAKCLYEESEQRELMQTLLDYCLITYDQDRDVIDREANDPKLNHPDQKYFKFFERFRGDFLKVMAVVKHPHFAEEREWRVISGYRSKLTDSDIKYREGASMLTPYIELQLSPEGDQEALFDSIILGPSRHQNLSMSALGSFISGKNIVRTGIYNCMSPYREW